MNMSFRPPTNKSNYGDDLTEDTWSQTSTPSATQPDYASDYRDNHSEPLSYQNRAPNLKATQSGFQPQQANIEAAANSITQDDILFMRTWQRDSFIKRVVPLSIVGWSALFVYNKSKELPNKISRYLLVGAGAFLLGKYSYKNEFKRRLSENRSNTPYMQALRRALGVEIRVTEFGSDPNSDYNNMAVNDSSNWNNRGDISGSNSSFGEETRPSNEPNRSSFETENLTGSGGVGSSSKPSTTYDELRAKNRGYIK